MQIGVIFPQTEIGADPGAIREYAQAVEGLGYTHLLTFEHVVGADPQGHPGWRGVYTFKDLFHEPFTLFSYLAAVTQRLELVTGILILPQRQTVLVAKQAAQVDLLSGGRFRLGIGVGWNAVEYEALGQEFHNRGRRVEEQVEVLRLLWTQEVVTYQGRWHHITAAGINPMPVQRPIPIWMGGGAEPVLRRIGRLADGWLPQLPPNETTRAAIERLRGYARDAGRDPAALGIGPRLSMGQGNPDDWARQVQAWRELGATHLTVNAMNSGLSSAAQHIQAIRRFREEVPRAFGS